MIFREAKLKGAFIIEPERLMDDRGFFARTWCERECRSHNINPNIVQCNMSFNMKKGTLRGMHFQTPPYEEAKLVRCTSGAVYDVIIDLRPDSETFKQWISEELSRENRKMIYVPEGFAHGFLTLEDNTEVFYQMSQFYNPDHGAGVRWNDPAFGIHWPMAARFMSDRDLNFPDFPS